MGERASRGDAFTELVLEVLRVNGLLIEAGDEMTRPVGLSSARWQVLGVVEHGPVPVSYVARIMGLTRQGVQQTADALAKDGFIEYVENPHHRRAKLMKMTAKGREALDYVGQRRAGWADRIGEEQSLEDLRAAVAVLQEVRESLVRNAPLPTERKLERRDGR